MLQDFYAECADAVVEDLCSVTIDSLFQYVFGDYTPRKADTTKSETAKPSEAASKGGETSKADTTESKTEKPSEVETEGFPQQCGMTQGFLKGQELYITTSLCLP